MHLPQQIDLSALGNKSLLLALSGGLDSMVLLDLLVQADKKPALAHVNFQLRGAQSEADQQLVEEIARQHGLILHLHRADARQYAQKERCSVQEAARRLRYDFFAELMQEAQIDILLTAHHLDDDMETSLLFWSRGSGIRGLSGIPQRANCQRPLLQTPKKALLAYAQERGLSWREDASNAQTDYLRNRLRHDVLPALGAQLNNWPGGVQTSLAQLKKDRANLEALLQERLEEELQKTGGLEILDLKKLHQRPYFQALLHHWLKERAAFDWEALAQLDLKENGQRFDQASWCLRHDRGRLLFWRQTENRLTRVSIQQDQQSIAEPLSLSFSKQAAASTELLAQEDMAQLDFDQLQFPLTLRPWRAGDHFQPLGMQGEKKLSDFLIDLKLSPLEKERQYVLCSGETIVWVLGRRIHHRYRLNNSTKTVYFVRINSL